MSKKIKLNIAEPCHEDWDAMNPTEQGRFCNSCKKQVIDFSMMSDRQIAQFFKKPSAGSLCGRFMNDQLGREIEMPRKRIPWVKYFFQFAIPAFLASVKVSAQQTMGKINPLKIESVRGNVPLAPAPVASENISKTRSVLDDTIALQEVRIVSYGYSTKGRVVMGGLTRVTGKTIANNIKDTLFSKSDRALSSSPKLFPNPVKQGQSLTISISEKQETFLQLRITDLSGRQLFLQSQQWIPGSNVLMATNSRWAPGIYIVTVTGDNGKLLLQEKLLIQ